MQNLRFHAPVFYFLRKAVAVFAVLFLFQTAVSAATIDWIRRDPTSAGRSWNDASNWSSATVPTSADTVNVIPTAPLTNEVIASVLQNQNGYAGQLNISEDSNHEATVDVKQYATLTVGSVNVGLYGYGRLDVYGMIGGTNKGTLTTTGEVRSDGIRGRYI